jgi:hypothetical protein
MVNRNGIIGRFLSRIDRINAFLGIIGTDITAFLRDAYTEIDRGLRNLTVELPKEISQYKEYRRRICHLCGLKVPRGEGTESCSSFILYGRFFF